MTQVWTLRAQPAGVGDGKDHHLYRLPFSDPGYTALFLALEPERLPSPISFEGDPERLRGVDVPHTNTAWPVMSRRVLDELLAAGEVPCVAHPVLVFDHAAPRAARTAIASFDFVVPQLTTHLDAVDPDRSEFRPALHLPGQMTVRRLVLRAPREGFPPLFRVEGALGSCFVSEAGRRAIDAIGAVGARFEPQAVA